MIVDTSALLSVVFDEADAPLYARAMLDSPSASISAGNVLEAFIVTDGRRNDILSAKAGEIVEGLRLEIVPLTDIHVVLARQAYREYGKGNHPAALNFGDCIAYALAKATGEPLLFKGNDFSRVDVRAALIR